MLSKKIDFVIDSELIVGAGGYPDFFSEIDVVGLIPSVRIHAEKFWKSVNSHALPSILPWLEDNFIQGTTLRIVFLDYLEKRDEREPYRTCKSWMSLFEQCQEFDSFFGGSYNKRKNLKAYLNKILNQASGHDALKIEIFEHEMLPLKSEFFRLDKAFCLTVAAWPKISYKQIIRGLARDKHIPGLPTVLNNMNSAGYAKRFRSSSNSRITQDHWHFSDQKALERRFYPRHQSYSFSQLALECIRRRSRKESLTEISLEDFQP